MGSWDGAMIFMRFARQKKIEKKLVGKLVYVKEIFLPESLCHVFSKCLAYALFSLTDAVYTRQSLV